MIAKRVRSFVAGTLAVAMVISIVPQPVKANERQTNSNYAIGENGSGKLKANKTSEYVEGQAIVYYYQSQNKMQSKSTNPFGEDIQIVNSFSLGNEKNLKVKSTNSMATSKIQVAKVKSGKYTTDQIIKQCKNKSFVKYVEPNYRIHKADVPNDTYLKSQWAIDNQTDGYLGKDINAESQKVKASKSEKQRVIALVDTGMDYEHEDLLNAVWDNNEDATGLDGKHGYDFINSDNDPMDDNGHGTHCAGIMAAKSNNDKGISGVDDGAKIMALKMLDETGSGYYYEALEAYYYIYQAQQKGVPVVAVNNSWSGLSDEETPILNDLITKVGESGAISCFAAGNESTNIDQMPQQPSCMDNKYVISVGASAYNQKVADFSNYGKSNVDIFAPGASILSSVSYICFNPTIYDAQKRNNLCGVFNYDADVTSKLLVWKSGKLAVEKNTNHGFPINSNEKNCLQYKLNLSAENGEDGDSSLELLYPVSEVDSEQYISYMECLEPKDPITIDEKYGAGTSESSWYHVSKKFGDCETVGLDGVDYYLIEGFDGLPACDIDYYLDNIGISNKGVDPKEFGKYDFYNGTSMATPFVTGSVAMLSASYPNDDTMDRKERLLNSSTKVAGMDKFCKSGGILDLANSDKNIPIIDSAKMTAKGLDIKGYFFGDEKGQIKINGKEVSESDVTWSNKAIFVSNIHFNNTKATIEITTKNESINPDDSKAFIEQYFTYGVKSIKFEGKLGDGANGVTMTDGKKLYMLHSITNDFTVLDGSEQDGYQLKSLSKLNCKELFNGYDLIFRDELCNSITDFVYDKGNFYGLVRCNLKGFTLTGLVSYNIKNDSWSKVCDLKGELEKKDGLTLGMVNGKLYIAGGIDKKGNLGKEVYEYNESSKQFDKNDALPLPEERALGKLISMSNKMVYVMGTNGKGGYPRNLIFNGKEWTESKADETQYPCSDKRYYVTKSEMNIEYFFAQTGLCDKGIMFAGATREGLGDVYAYNVEKDTYDATDYSLQADDLKGKADCGTTVDNKFFLFANDLNYDSESIDDLYTNGRVYSIPIESAYANVTANVEEDAGTVSGEGTYLKGQNVTLQFSPAAGKCLVAFKDDAGKVLSTNNQLTFCLTKDTVIDVQTADYVSSIKFKSKVSSIAVGQPQKLMPVILPVTARGINFSWTSSNTKYATVSADGVVTVSKAGVGKSVTITVKYKYNQKISANIQIKIKEIKLKKLFMNVKKATLKAGAKKQLKVSYRPSNASFKNIKWRSSNKRFAIVSSKGLVTTKKKGKGKTVTIYAYGSNKKMATCKIKIK